MDNKDIIIRQAAKILELEDALIKANDSAKYSAYSSNEWYQKFKNLEDKISQGEPNE